MSATSIFINIGSKTVDAVRGITDVNKALEEQEKSTGKAGSAVKKMAVPAAAAFTAVAVAAGDFAAAAVEDAAGAQRMADNLAKSTGATEEQIAATEDWISAQGAALGVADDDLRPAMERLARSTGDLGEAQDLATLSMDIAAATGKDLETVSGAVAKANDGQMGALKKLGLTLGDQAENTEDYTKAQEDLAKAQGEAQSALIEFGPASKEYAKAMEKVDGATADVAAIAERGVDWVGELGDQMGGAASSQADTAAGKMERFQLALSETGESIGAALLPLIEELLGPMGALAAFAQENSTALAILMGIVGGLAGVVLVVNGVMAAWSAITAVWSAVTAVATAVGGAFGAVVAVITSPVTLIILAIVALIAVVVLLWKNWDKVTKALGKAWDWLKAKAVAVFNSLKAFLSGVWNSIKDSVVGVWNNIKTFLSGAWDSIKTKATGVFTGLKTTLTSIWDGIKTAVSDKITALISLVTGMPARIVKAIGDLGKLLYAKGQELVEGMIKGIKSEGLISYVAGLPGKIVKAIGSLSKTLYQKGRDLVQGLINGIKSLLGSIGKTISDAIPDWVPGFGKSATVTGVSPSAAAFMAPTPAAAPQTVAVAEPTVLVTEEQIYRAVARLLLRGDARNGRAVLVG